MAAPPPFFAASPLRPIRPSSDPSAACDAIAAVAAPALSRALRDRSAAFLRLLRDADHPFDLLPCFTAHAPSPAPVVSALLPTLLANLLNAHP